MIFNFRSKDEIRQARRQMQLDNKLYSPTEFREMPQHEWPDSPVPPEKVYRSRDFLVLIFSVIDGARRISVCRTTINRNGALADGISWEELQWIKNKVGFGGFDAVEIYPAEPDVVNVANIRHLWVLSQSLPFAWRKKT